MKFIPRNYQAKAFQFALDNYKCALFLDMGLGKTATILMLLEFLKDIEGESNSTLIFGTKRIVRTTWPDEIAKWGFNLTFEVCHGKKKLEALKREADIYLVNYEGIPWLFDQRESKKLNILIADELTKLKSTKSTRWRELKKHMKQFYRVIGLTGMPAPNGYEDLYGQIRLLDGGDSLGKTKKIFQGRYMINKGRDYADWQMRKGSREKIEKAIEHLTLTMETEDYLDLPEMIFVPHYIELTGKARQIYDEMEREFFIEFEEDEIEAVNAGVLRGKLHQIASGALYFEDRSIMEIHSEKMDFIIDELFPECEGNCLVAYNYQHELKRFKDRIPNLVYMGKGVKDDEQDIIQAEWNAGIHPHLFGNPQSIAHGLNLQDGGNHVVWVSLTDNLDHFVQFNKRLHRSGQTKPVFIHLVLAKDTVDLVVWSNLKNKTCDQQSLIDSLKKYQKKRLAKL